MYLWKAKIELTRKWAIKGELNHSRKQLMYSEYFSSSCWSEERAHYRDNLMDQKSLNNMKAHLLRETSEKKLCSLFLHAVHCTLTTFRRLITMSTCLTWILLSDHMVHSLEITIKEHQNRVDAHCQLNMRN